MYLKSKVGPHIGFMLQSTEQALYHSNPAIPLQWHAEDTIQDSNLRNWHGI